MSVCHPSTLLRNDAVPIRVGGLRILGRMNDVTSGIEETNFPISVNEGTAFKKSKLDLVFLSISQVRLTLRDGLHIFSSEFTEWCEDGLVPCWSRKGSGREQGDEGEGNAEQAKGNHGV